jgi:hypothetical protein
MEQLISSPACYVVLARSRLISANDDVIRLTIMLFLSTWSNPWLNSAEAHDRGATTKRLDQNLWWWCIDARP